MIPDDTIVAVSSASGPAARMIVRTSGPSAIVVAHQIAPGLSRFPGSAERTLLHFSGVACPGWIYLFTGPRSYTGDDLVEYHLPGNPVLAGLLMRHLREAGLRPAEPGEFTARAYLNGRMNLTAAEGVAATIAAGSEQELAAARRLMGGELARRLAPAMELLADTLALLEIGIDFSDEDVAVLPAPELRTRVETCAGLLRSLLDGSSRFEQLAHEPSFVLVGWPNAGKSTLLNALAGWERAVASPTAGTTRDVLSAEVILPRGRVRVIDVAGLDPATDDESSQPRTPLTSVHSRMQARAMQAIDAADFVVLVQEAGTGADASISPRRPDLIVLSKTDLTNHLPADSTRLARRIPVSAVIGDGMAELRDAMDTLAFGRAGTETRLALNGRHVSAVERAITSLGRAAAAPGGEVELCAADLRDALQALGEVLGHVSPDELLGRIFSQFCIGK
jgi:tRNA modification GTPase